MNLPHGQKINGKVPKHITASGPVYVRWLYDIEDNEVITVQNRKF